MLPSGLKNGTDEDFRTSEVGTGLYVVEDAYAGEYDFFAPSRLYSAQEETTSACELKSEATKK
jgi:hypothetical protein